MERDLYVVWSDCNGGLHSDSFSEEEVNKRMMFDGVLNHLTLEKYFRKETEYASNRFHCLISWQWEDAFEDFDMNQRFWNNYNKY